MNKIFSSKEPSHHSRNVNIQTKKCKNRRYGNETVSLLGSRIWNLLPIE